MKINEPGTSVDASDGCKVDLSTLPQNVQEIPKIKCNNCEQHVDITDSDFKSLQQLSFVKTVVKSDFSCFKYTGIPTVKVLNYLFDWLSSSAKTHIKLLAGKRKAFQEEPTEAGKEKS